MPKKERDPTLTSTFVRGVGESTRHNALAFGYSLALTGSFGVAAAVSGAPTVVDIFLWAFGASLTFTLMNAAVTRGFRTRVADEPPIVLALGSSLGFVSVLLAIGAAALVALVLSDWAGWLVGAFVASTVYLVGTALELSLAHGLRVLVGREHLEDPR